MIVVLLAIHPEIALGAWEQFARVIGLAGEPVPASPAVFSDHEVEEIEGLPPREQVMRPLPRATNHYQGAIELPFGKDPAAWRVWWDQSR